MTLLDDGSTTGDAAAAARAASAALDRIAAARAAIGTVIYGQQDVVDQALVTLLAGGHGLLVGVPGLAKTKLVETLGIVLGLDTRRVQFTPDLMPADIHRIRGARGKRRTAPTQPSGSCKAARSSPNC